MEKGLPLLPFSTKSKAQMTMNDTIKAKKHLFSSGNITIDGYIDQAIFGVCKSNAKRFTNIWVDLQPTEAIKLLEI